MKNCFIHHHVHTIVISIGMVISYLWFQSNLDQVRSLLHVLGIAILQLATVYSVSTLMHLSIKSEASDCGERSPIVPMVIDINHHNYVMKKKQYYRQAGG